MKNLFPSEFRVLAKLGEGSFAEVFKVKSLKDNQLYAIKRLKKRFRTHEEVNNLPEVTSLSLLQGHPNVVKLYDVLFDSSSGYVALVFELMDYNLYEYVKVLGRACNEEQSLLFIYQLLKGVSYMHSKNLFHRDVKPENCMVNKETMELKLVDFGSTRPASGAQPYTEYVSTRWYRAPECILTSGSYSKEVDVWAVGCMLYELLTTRPLFPGKHELDQITRIHQVVGTPSRDVLAQFRKNPNTQISFSFPTRHPQDFRKLLSGVQVSNNTLDLLSKLLTYDPRERITAQQALNHPCFEKFVAIDERWKYSGENIPFPLFYRNHIQKFENMHFLQPSRVAPSSIISENGVHNLNGIESLNNDLQDKGQQMKQVSYQTQNQPSINSNYSHIPNNQYLKGYHKVFDYIQPKKKPLIIAPKLPEPKQPNIGISLKEARLRAAQRIREYNKKKYGSDNSILQNNPSNPNPGVQQLPQKKPDFHPYKYMKQYNNLLNKQVIYQKPAPENIQPRPPKLNQQIYFK